jgi:hypothetical protein
MIAGSPRSSVSAVRGNEQGELPWQTMNAVAL